MSLGAQDLAEAALESDRDGRRRDRVGPEDFKQRRRR
jgi:hypothetical protein